MKILHIGTDSKFVKSAAEQISQAFQDSVQDYYILNGDYTVHGFEHKQLFEKVLTLKEGKSIPKTNVNKYDFVFIHFLHPESCKFIYENRVYKNFVWFVWGSDLYTHIPSFPLFRKRTKQIRKSTIPVYKRYVVLARKRLYKHYLDIVFKKSFVIKNVIHIAAVTFQEDLDILNKYFPSKENRKKFTFNYFPVSSYKSEKQEEDKSFILVGNSSHFVNNHIDLLDSISEGDLGAYKIVAPLNYGNKAYGDYVENYGENLFGNKFEALRVYMPLAEYEQQILARTGIAIFGNLRQKAFGNIVSCLMHGAKVYLSEKNTIYHFLKRKNIIVKSIEESLEKDIKLGLENLSKREVENNRSILTAMYSKEKLVTSLRVQLLELKKPTAC